MAASFGKTKTSDAALERLGEKLLGRWKVSGEAQGKITFEWLKEGLFLQQKFDLTVFGRRNQGIEIIGRLRLPGQAPSKDLCSRAYIFSEGQTFDYVYKLQGSQLTIWFGEKNPRHFFKGQFSADGKSYEGDWRWPGGGYHIKALWQNS